MIFPFGKGKLSQGAGSFIYISCLFLRKHFVLRQASIFGKLAVVHLDFILPSLQCYYDQ